MIQCCATVSGRDDAASVLLEHRLVSLNRHRNRLLSNSLFQSQHVLSRHLRVLQYLDLASVGREAAIRDARVRILRLQHNTVAHRIIKAVGLPPTIAAVRFPVAVNALLLRQLEELPSLNLVGALNGTNGGEGPARAAPPLILNLVDSAGIDPVD